MAIKRSRFGVALFWLALLALVGVPPAIVTYHAHRTGLGWARALVDLMGGGSGAVTTDAILPPGEKIDFLVSEPIGNDFTAPPKIANVASVDLDQDGLMDVVVCDCENNYVSWIRQQPLGTFQEQVIAELMCSGPCGGHRLRPGWRPGFAGRRAGHALSQQRQIGSVVILENDGQMNFRRHVVVERIARVSDVRGGDLDGDGDLDLAVAQFGYDDGETRWLENLGDWQFESHLLQSLSGPIHCEIADYDADGHLGHRRAGQPGVGRDLFVCRPGEEAIRPAPDLPVR